MIRTLSALKLISMAALFALSPAAHAMGGGENKSCTSSLAQIQASWSGTTQVFKCSQDMPNMAYSECRPTQSFGGPGNPSDAYCKSAKGQASDGTDAFEATCYKHPGDTSFTKTCTVEYDCCQ